MESSLCIVICIVLMDVFMDMHWLMIKMIRCWGPRSPWNFVSGPLSNTLLLLPLSCFHSIIDLGHFTMRAFLSKSFYNGNISITFMCDLAPPVWPVYLSKFPLQFSALNAPHFPWINEAWTEFLSCLLPLSLLTPNLSLLIPSLKNPVV